MRLILTGLELILYDMVNNLLYMFLHGLSIGAGVAFPNLVISSPGFLRVFPLTA